MLARVLRAADRRRSCATSAPGSHGQTGYTGLLVETAASVGRPGLEGDAQLGPHAARRATRCAAGTRTATCDQVLPEAAGPRHHRRADRVPRPDRRSCSAGSSAIIAVGLGASTSRSSTTCSRDGTTLTRAIRYPPMGQAPERTEHVWAGRARRHQPHHRASAGDRPGPAGAVGGTTGRRVGRRAVDATPCRRRATSSSTPGSCWSASPTASSPSGCTGWWPTPASPASATPWCSSATRRRGRSCRPFGVAASARTTRSATPASRPATCWTRCIYDINLVEDARRVEDGA